MNEDIQTLELARIYESQGYFKDAFEIYSYLDKNTPGNEITEGLKRMEDRMNTPEKNDEKKIFLLFEKWLELMILKQRFNHFNHIKSRLI